MAEKFWAGANLEPKRQHRWLLLMAGIPAFVVKTATKPSFNIANTQHKYFGHTFNYPGNVEWNPVEVKMVDPIDPDTSKALQRVLMNSGYDVPTARLELNDEGLFTASKQQAVSALGGIVTLQQIGARGDVPNKILEEWDMHNPWVEKVTFGSLAYDSDAMVEIDMTIRYDYAILR